jgi:hypothetical protein
MRPGSYAPTVCNMHATGVTVSKPEAHANDIQKLSLLINSYVVCSVFLYLYHLVTSCLSVFSIHCVLMVTPHGDRCL